MHIISTKLKLLSLLSDLVQFSNLTTGTISLSDNSIGLEGSSSEIASALALNLNDSYKGDITITNNLTLSKTTGTYQSTPGLFDNQ